MAPPSTGRCGNPCSEPPAEIDLGEITAKFGITARGAMNCKIRGDRLPLVVVSHGKGSHFVLHHDTAETLADAGFVVAAVNHPGDTFFDISRTSDLSIMVERPTDIKRLVDFMVGISPAASKIDPEHRLLWVFAGRLYRARPHRRRSGLGQREGFLPARFVPLVRADPQQGISDATARA
jgi:hypothetical protein